MLDYPSESILTSSQSRKILTAPIGQEKLEASAQQTTTFNTKVNNNAAFNVQKETERCYIDWLFCQVFHLMCFVVLKFFEPNVWAGKDPVRLKRCKWCLDFTLCPQHGFTLSSTKRCRMSVGWMSGFLIGSIWWKTGYIWLFPSNPIVK